MLTANEYIPEHNTSLIRPTGTQLFRHKYSTLGVFFDDCFSEQFISQLGMEEVCLVVLLFHVF